MAKCRILILLKDFLLTFNQEVFQNFDQRVVRFFQEILVNYQTQNYDYFAKFCDMGDKKNFSVLLQLVYDISFEFGNNFFPTDLNGNASKFSGMLGKVGECGLQLQNIAFLSVGEIMNYDQKELIFIEDPRGGRGETGTEKLKHEREKLFCVFEKEADF